MVGNCRFRSSNRFILKLYKNSAFQYLVSICFILSLPKNCPYNIINKVFLPLDWLKKAFLPLHCLRIIPITLFKKAFLPLLIGSFFAIFVLFFANSSNVWLSMFEKCRLLQQCDKDHVYNFINAGIKNQIFSTWKKIPRWNFEDDCFSLGLLMVVLLMVCALVFVHAPPTLAQSGWKPSMPRWSSSSGRLYAAAVGSSSYSMLLLLLLIGAATVYVVAFVRRTRGHDEAF